MASKRRIIFIGDAGVSSGFARGTHNYVLGLQKSFDVHVLGLNYDGDPHKLPYPIYKCSRNPHEDGFGIVRMNELIRKLGPSAIVVQNDPWNFREYIKHAGNVPVVGIVAVDGRNCQGGQLNGLASAIFWTQFGLDEARLGGYGGRAAVIPLGVDLDIYKPMDRLTVRKSMGLDKILATRNLPPDSFIVGVVGRNQARKRLDLTLEYFAEWVHGHKINDAVLWLHVAPTGEKAIDLDGLAEYYHISDRIMIPDIEPIHGVPEEFLARAYNVFDTGFSTTQGEGFGLPCFEMMACGIPQIVPDWSALGELTEDAAVKIHCPTTAVTAIGGSSIGGIADKEMAVYALNKMYEDHELRKQCSERSLSLVQQDRYRWENIQQAVHDEVQSALFESPVFRQQPLPESDEDCVGTTQV